MKLFALILFLLFPLLTGAQSGRAPVAAENTDGSASGSTVKQLFEDTNGYIRAKAAEFEAKKVAFSDRLLDKVKLEQRQLAAKNAAIAAARKDLAGEDLYYLGMLHWIAENLDGTADNLKKFIAADTGPEPRRQTARSVVVVVLAKQRKLEEAEALLAAYLKTEPTKPTERARIEVEMAKGYKLARDFARMAPHAEEGYAAAKALLKESASRARGLDEILDAGMLVFEAYRDLGNQKKADEALDDMRVTAVVLQSPSFYYFAVDRRITYMIETGRKPAALAFYAAEMANGVKGFVIKTAENDAVSRLKRRDRHYKILGEAAPDLPMVDQWFPGPKKTMADLRGKVVLLDFWAMWCMPCFEAFPSLIEWHQQLSGQGFEILGVTRYYETLGGVPIERPAEMQVLKRFREKEKLPYDFVVGDGQAIQLLYGGTALPTAVLIDRKGVVRYVESGANSMRLVELREMIAKLLAEK
ncbi:MAG: TlpA family protein disulfide reductase [Pyrinomonadaceae bacterium]